MSKQFIGQSIGQSNRMKAWLAPVSTAALLALGACGSSDGNERALSKIDADLTSKAGDPAVEGALEEQILIDPQLADSANGNAVRAPGAPANGAVPTNTAYEGAMATAADLNGLKLISAGKPRVVSEEELCTDCQADKNGMTLGAKAEKQKAQRGTCDANLSYGMDWANRMPATFPVYPKGRVMEAAGVEGGACSIRVVSFSSANSMQQIVDYYFTRARGAGFTAEYILRDGEHALGGVRAKDDGAYYITFRLRKDGGTDVDIVANGGR